MKLLIITSVKTFEEKVKKLLAENHVITYSYSLVTGYRDSTQETVIRNWFATEMNKTESLLFFAFVSDEIPENVFESIEELNKTCDIHSKVHIAITPIEKSNTTII
jgi:nitrogen regulatory protein PII